MKPRLVVLFAVVVLAVVVGVIWFLQSQPAGAPSVVSATPAPVEYKPAIVDNGQVPATPEPIRRTKIVDGTALAAPARELTDWERKIDQILSNTAANETQTAQLLIDLVPTLPPEGQAEATQHITNLITDKDYARVMPMLRNRNLAEEVQDLLVNDLMNRDDTVKLPVLLEVAKNPAHPHHEEAMSDLQIFLDQDNGTNWSKWDGAVRDYLRKQAAQNAEAPVPQ